MSSEDNDEIALAAVLQQYKIWMTRIALLHHEHSDASGRLIVDIPSHASLQLLQAGVLTSTEDTSCLPLFVLDVLQDANHEARATNIPGPLLFFFSDHERVHVELIAVTELLHSDSLATREAALVFFQGLCHLPSPPITRLSIATLDRVGPELRVQEATRWRQAAVDITDVLQDDFLLNLAGVRQSIAFRSQQGLEISLPRILQPTLRGVDSIDIGPSDLSSSNRALRTIVETFAHEAATVYDACQSYYQLLGHLPLASHYSLGAVLGEWVNQHGLPIDLWYRVWMWALESGSPLTRYHACVAFLQHPEWIPPDQLSVLWNQILMVVDGAYADQSMRPGWSGWQLRIILARYYAQYWECQVSKLDGERVAAMAWWMAEHVANVLGPTYEWTNFYLKRMSSTWANMMQLEWTLFSQGALPSRLRYLTHRSDGLWAISLLCSFKRINTLHPEALSPAIQLRMTKSFSVLLFCHSPAVVCEQEDKVFAFDTIPQEAIREWGQVTDPMHYAPFLNVLTGEYPNTWADPVAQLQEFSQFDSSAQLLSATYLQLLADIGKLPADQVWPVISDRSWLDTVLLSSSPKTLEILVDALIALQQQVGDCWVTSLPHLFAIACEHADDSSRGQMLFYYIVRLCITGNAMSAIERVLAGPRNAEYIPLARILHTNIAALMPHVNPSVASRIRSVLPSLMIP